MGTNTACTYLGRALLILIRHASNALANDLWEGWQPEQGEQELECDISLATRVVSSSARFLNFASTPRRLTLQLFRRCVTYPLTIGTIGIEHFY